MATDDPEDLERVDREIRINELKHRAEELAEGALTSWEAEESPPVVSEGFWRGVVDYEAAPWTTHLRQLEALGIVPPAAETLSDPELTARLWTVIHGLARIRVFLENTDHLSDRELYTLLQDELLDEEVKDLPVDEHSAWHLDILGGCSEEDMYLHRKHYADYKDRRRWAEEYPDDEMPAHEDPPYDRDRHLPRVSYGPPRAPQDDVMGEPDQ